jgi:hypothetical protein
MKSYAFIENTASLQHTRMLIGLIGDHRPNKLKKTSRFNTKYPSLTYTAGLNDIDNN